MAILLAKIVDCYNIRMGEPGDQPGFEIKAIDKIAVCCIPGWENLDRNLSVKILLMCPVHTCHASLAKGSQYFIFTKESTNQGILLHNLVSVPLKCNQRLAKTKTVWPS